MRRIGVVLVLAVAVTALLAPAALAAKPGFGNLYYDDEVVRTVVPPAAMPQEGTDPFYVVTEGGVEGQLGIAAVAPGDADYRGGKWAFHAVTWNVEPQLLTSEADVLAAEAAGDVTVTRIVENDFKCPIQP
jgi:hypothetical protein